MTEYDQLVNMLQRVGANFIEEDRRVALEFSDDNYIYFNVFFDFNVLGKLTAIEGSP